MAISRSHFDEVTNGYERTTSGLWTHKGNLGVAGGATVSGNISGSAITANGQLLTGSSPPRIPTGGYADAHLRIDQPMPGESRIGFHEIGNTALALYKPAGSQNQVRIRGSDGADYAVAGAPGTGQVRLGSYTNNITWSVPAAGAWYETAAQVNTATTGYLIRCEVSGSIISNTAAALVYVGFGVDGSTTHPSMVASAIPNAGWPVPFSFTVYVQPLAGAHRFSVWVYSNVANASGLSNHAFTSVNVTEQRI